MDELQLIASSRKRSRNDDSLLTKCDDEGFACSNSRTDRVLGGGDGSMGSDSSGFQIKASEMGKAFLVLSVIINLQAYDIRPTKRLICILASTIFR